MLGIHTHKGKAVNIIQAWERDFKLYPNIAYQASQIMVSNPRNGSKVNIGDIKQINNYIEENKLRVIIHGSYVLNKFWKNSDTSSLYQEMKLASELKVEGLVIHLPKLKPEEVANALKGIQNPVKLLLENHSYKSDDKSYETPQKLNKLTQLLIENKISNWGYCIDTAHIWTTMSNEDRKKYAIETKEGFNNWLNDLSDETKKHIYWWHFNGSEKPHGKGPDTHAIPIYGAQIKDHMFTEDLEKTSIPALMKWSKQYNTPLIMEINNEDTNNTNKCINLILSFMNKTTF
jgi:endonuclease IV